jgi:hypothetical protein
VLAVRVVVQEQMVQTGLIPYFHLLLLLAAVAALKVFLAKLDLMVAPVVAGLIQPAAQEFLVKVMLVAMVAAVDLVAAAVAQVLLVGIDRQVRQVLAVMVLQIAFPVPRSPMAGEEVGAAN